MNRRGFLTGLASFTILPAATTYQRIWRPQKLYPWGYTCWMSDGTMRNETVWVPVSFDDVKRLVMAMQRERMNRESQVIPW